LVVELLVSWRQPPNDEILVRAVSRRLNVDAERLSVELGSWDHDPVGGEFWAILHFAVLPQEQHRTIQALRRQATRRRPVFTSLERSGALLKRAVFPSVPLAERVPPVERRKHSSRKEWLSSPAWSVRLASTIKEPTMNARPHVLTFAASLFVFVGVTACGQSKSSDSDSDADSDSRSNVELGDEGNGGGNDPPPDGEDPPPGGNNPPPDGEEPPVVGEDPPSGGQQPPPAQSECAELGIGSEGECATTADGSIIARSCGPDGDVVEEWCGETGNPQFGGCAVKTQRAQCIAVNEVNFLREEPWFFCYDGSTSAYAYALAFADRTATHIAPDDTTTTGTFSFTTGSMGIDVNVPGQLADVRFTFGRLDVGDIVLDMLGDNKECFVGYYEDTPGIDT
jgi:hypothetical protein